MSRFGTPPDGRAAARRAGAGAALLATAVLALPPLAAPAAAGPAIGGPGMGPQPFLPTATATAAIPAAPAPAPATPLPSGVEAFSPWLPQVSCDPVAKPGVKAFAALALATWGRGRTAALTRSCSAGGGSEHMEGRAWDWGLDPTNYADVVAGSRAVSWLLANNAVNARRVGIMYVIWNKRIWSTYRRAEGWRPYTGADPHTSHIHISFSWAGAMKRTSWWTGAVAPIEYGPCILVAGDHAPPYGETINLKPCPPPGEAESEVTVTAQDTSTRPRTRFTPPPAP